MSRASSLHQAGERLHQLAGHLVAPLWIVAAVGHAVFAAIVLSGEMYIKLTGIGLVAAVLIDATVVRMVLLPAVMQLLGERNWWLRAGSIANMPRLELEPQAAGRR